MVPPVQCLFTAKTTDAPSRHDACTLQGHLAVTSIIKQSDGQQRFISSWCEPTRGQRMSERTGARPKHGVPSQQLRPHKGRENGGRADPHVRVTEGARVLRTPVLQVPPHCRDVSILLARIRKDGGRRLRAAMYYSNMVKVLSADR